MTSWPTRVERAVVHRRLPRAGRRAREVDADHGDRDRLPLDGDRHGAGVGDVDDAAGEQRRTDERRRPRGRPGRGGGRGRRGRTGHRREDRHAERGDGQGDDGDDEGLHVADASFVGRGRRPVGAHVRPARRCPLRVLLLGRTTVLSRRRVALGAPVVRRTVGRRTTSRRVTVLRARRGLAIAVPLVHDLHRHHGSPPARRRAPSCTSTVSTINLAVTHRPPPRGDLHPTGRRCAIVTR